MKKARTGEGTCLVLDLGVGEWFVLEVMHGEVVEGRPKQKALAITR